jgi:hypothetical protein
MTMAIEGAGGAGGAGGADIQELKQVYAEQRAFQKELTKLEVAQQMFNNAQKAMQKGSDGMSA